MAGPHPGELHDAESPATDSPGPGESGGLGAEQHAELLPRSALLRSIFHWIGLIEQAVGTVFIGIVLVLVLMQVLQRYVPGGGMAWTGEVARLAMVWATFALSGFLMAHDRHISIQVVDLVLRPRPLAAVQAGSHLVVVAACVAMAYSTYRLIADDIGQVTAAAELPLAWVYLIPLIGFVLTALRAALAVVISDVPRLRGEPGVAA